MPALLVVSLLGLAVACGQPFFRARPIPPFPEPSSPAAIQELSFERGPCMDTTCPSYRYTFLHRWIRSALPAWPPPYMTAAFSGCSLTISRPPIERRSPSERCSPIRSKLLPTTAQSVHPDSTSCRHCSTPPARGSLGRSGQRFSVRARRVLKTLLEVDWHCTFGRLAWPTP
jgi:hypothetical protein